MNVYDFDKTIYKNDSATDFYFHCLTMYPYLFIFWPYQLIMALLWGLRIVSRGVFKQEFFRFLLLVPRIDDTVADFWLTHRQNIFFWYAMKHRDNDLVISASPEFLLKPICKELGISLLLATRMDPRTGTITGENCYGKEKPRRFRAAFPSAPVNDFYSDSKSDQPMADLARRSFLVQNGKIVDWK